MKEKQKKYEQIKVSIDLFINITNIYNRIVKNTYMLIKIK